MLQLNFVESKSCQVCGRIIELRKKWIKNWKKIKYFSEQCRRNKVSDNYEELILELLRRRAVDKTICPSEILSDLDKQNIDKMNNVRAAARRLVNKGLISTMQKGIIVNPSTAKGPIRLKLIR